MIEAGFQSELGTWLDFWFADNPSPLYQNEFSAKSSPNSRSNRNYALSNIMLIDFSANNNTTMTFSYKRDFFESGFPVNLNMEGPLSLTDDLYFVSVESINGPAIFTHNEQGDVFAISANGRGLFDNQNPKILDGSEKGQFFTVFADTNTNNAYDMIFTVSEKGRIAGYRLSDQNLDGKPDSSFVMELNREVNTLPVVRYPYLYIGTESGQIFKLHFAGTLEETIETGIGLSGFTVLDMGELKILPVAVDRPYIAPILIDLDSDGLQDTIYFDTEKKMRLVSSSLNKSIHLDIPVTGLPAFGDFDQDGYYEIFLSTGKALYAYKFNGAYVNNFPLVPVLQAGEEITGTPLVLDLDGDGFCDIALVTTAGQIYAYDHKGQLLDGFPFSTGAPIKGSLTAGDIDGDQKIELFAGNGLELFAWQLDVSGKDELTWWVQATSDPTNNQLVNRFLEQKISGIPELLPASKAYVYPNPNIENFTNIRYFLKRDASVNITIFDLAGDLVSRFEGPGIGAMDNEIRWQLDGISTGVYFCRIEADSGNEQAFQLIKIMVIK